jgi:elongation factor P
MLTINDLKIGTLINLAGDPYEVVFSQHVQMGRGGAILRTKLRHLISGNLIERTFKAGDKFEEAQVEKRKANFLYQEKDLFYFMDQENYDQFFLTKNQLLGKEKYLKENQEVTILFSENKPLSVKLPPKIELKVIETGAGVKGDTAQGSVTKEATLETGLVIKVPLFIKKGDIIRINTETGEYCERVSN